MKKKLQPPRRPGALEVGDVVAYYAVLGAPAPAWTGRVREVWPNGTPSCRKRMVLLDGKAGCVLESHCRPVAKL